jgi:hypothetical protein
MVGRDEIVAMHAGHEMKKVVMIVVSFHNGENALESDWHMY